MLKMHPFDYFLIINFISWLFTTATKELNSISLQSEKKLQLMIRAGHKLTPCDFNPGTQAFKQTLPPI